MKRKRNLFKTLWLMIIRYERWKLNPKNAEKVLIMNKFVTL